LIIFGHGRNRELNHNLVRVGLFLVALFLTTPAWGDAFDLQDGYFTRKGEKFLVKGVVYVPVYPGDLPWELARKKDLPSALQARIQSDIEAIKKMGANTIRFWDVPEFAYKALKETRDLALIQTIWFDGNQKDLQDASYKEKCRQAIRATLTRIYSVYSRENPPPVLAYLVGSELPRASIESTDALHPEIDSYQGRWVSAPKGSSATESFLAEMADYLKSYEKKNYGQSNLVSYANEVRTHDVLDTPFLYLRSLNI
jgi:hypothetical protein